MEEEIKKFVAFPLHPLHSKCNHLNWTWLWSVYDAYSAFICVFVFRARKELEELKAMRNDAVIAKEASKGQLEREEQQVYHDRKKREVELSKVRKEAEEKKMLQEQRERRLVR